MQIKMLSAAFEAARMYGEWLVSKQQLRDNEAGQA